MNGQTGEVSVDPSPEDLERFRREKEMYDRSNAVALAAEVQDCVTLDGVRVWLYGNIGRPEQVEEVQLHHLEGVGLCRTELIFMEKAEALGADLQEEVYRRVASGLEGKPLIIRTMDLGGDKIPPFLTPHFEANPLLGLRGLRFSLSKARALFQAQLSAILRAGENVRVLFPMVVGGGDLKEVIALLKQEAARLGIRALPPIGAMIETPSSLFALDQILDRVDFLDIGTNDLTQLMLAADRTSAAFVDALSTPHPTILRAIRQVVEAAARRGKPVAVCEEVADDPLGASALVGLGVRELSMSPVRAARVRYALQNVRASDLEARAARALNGDSTEDVRDLFSELARLQ